ncbi:hypothetical protein B296_00016824 [Ensete ventricosum]|uniref:Uncharacterized protein n=1 Tax=Ensete ventricosum TaxID=4639 RepID=A0A426Z8A3_ENSVE|nr:hypothetical protein B296_00016824 [Ensete ventricosum]
MVNKISTLRAEVQDLKVGAGPEVVVATEKQATDLQTKELLKEAEVGREKMQFKEDELLKLTQDTEVLQIELKSTSTKAIVEYKESQGFQLGLW